ncbi:MAG: hypothetical protein E7258_10300, partial [Lachnospiraceae bacterium]|nr:hypothetical protein [Lachnospiraceae bacterium]
MKKKTISIVITAILTFSLYGCGNDKGGKTTETISELSATEIATTEESITEIDTDNTQATTEATTETTTETTT